MPSIKIDKTISGLQISVTLRNEAHNNVRHIWPKA